MRVFMYINSVDFKLFIYQEILLYGMTRDR